MASGKTFYLSSSEPPSGHGDLTVTRAGARAGETARIDGPEDLLYDVGAQQLWGCGELAPRRYVFAVDVAALP